MRHVRWAAALIGLVTLLATSCASGVDEILGPTPDAEWVEDLPAVLSQTIADGVDDYDFSEPPYSTPVDYAPADVVGVSFGVEGGFLYVRIDFDGEIPSAPLAIAAAGEVEAQTVEEQSFSIVVDMDNNDLTGAGARNMQGTGGLQGADIFFGISMRYGGPPEAYAHYDFVANDIHFPRGQIVGEVGSGGPGSSHLIVRYDVSGLNALFWPAGDSVEIGGWSEAESDLYHEFVNDFLTTTYWTVPTR